VDAGISLGLGEVKHVEAVGEQRAVALVAVQPATFDLAQVQDYRRRGP
jgi:hypothetical protein